MNKMLLLQRLSYHIEEDKEALEKYQVMLQNSRTMEERTSCKMAIGKIEKSLDRKQQAEIYVHGMKARKYGFYKLCKQFGFRIQERKVYI